MGKFTLFIFRVQHCLYAHNGNVQEFLSLYIGKILKKSKFCGKYIQTKEIHFQIHRRTLQMDQKRRSKNTKIVHK